MNASYCERWWLSEKRPIDPLDERSAAQLHAQKGVYTALIGSAAHPTHVVSLDHDSVVVLFLDEDLRPYLEYQFLSSDQRPDRIFLKTAHHREYAGKSSDVAVFMTYKFEENGHTFMDRHDRNTGEVSQRETQGSNAGNWDYWPAFGRYDALLRKERPS